MIYCPAEELEVADAQHIVNHCLDWLESQGK